MSAVPKMRAAIRAQMLGNGIPDEHIDEIVDLGIHAATMANKAIADVVRRGSNPSIQLAVLGLGLSLSVAKAQETMNAMKYVAPSIGAIIKTVKFEVGP